MESYDENLALYIWGIYMGNYILIGIDISPSYMKEFISGNITGNIWKKYIWENMGKMYV